MKKERCDISKRYIYNRIVQKMPQRFEILSEVRREYRRFNTVGTQLTRCLNPPPVPDTNPADHFLANVDDLFEHVLRDVVEADMVGIDIHSLINQNNRPIAVRFRRRYQLSGDVSWSVFEMVTQSNARFKALDTLTLVLHSVRMPVGSGGVRTKGRPL